jgi:predicted GIY-YIG superfamily endonuclease
MLASRKHGTLYLGSALDLIQRIYEHKSGAGSRFAAKYDVTRLVWFQPFMLVAEARDREVAARVEDQSDRTRKSRLGRSIPDAHRRSTNALASETLTTHSRGAAQPRAREP